MAEAGIRMLRNVRLQFAPVPRLRADFFAPGTDWKKSSQSLHFGERLLQSAEGELKFALGCLLLRHVQGVANDIGWIAILAYRQVPIQPNTYFSIPRHNPHVSGIATTLLHTLQILGQGMTHRRR